MLKLNFEKKMVMKIVYYFQKTISVENKVVNFSFLKNILERIFNLNK